MVVSVENDKKWCDRVKEVCCDSGFFKLIHHDLGEGVNKMTSYKHISDKQFNSARLFYDKILSEYDLDFLFVDHWRSLRAKTVQYLHSKFKYVVYHDAYDRRKEYNFRDLRISNDYDRFLYKSFVASTGIIIKKPYEKKEDFKEALKKQGREFLYNMYPNKKYKHKLEEIK